MGLGKTIQALALILERPSNNAARKTTLIVAPVSLLKQWQREIEDKVKQRHALKTCIYHGPNKRKWTTEKLMQQDVVLTSYGTIRAEYKARIKNPTKVRVLLSPRARFYRIILDEAHNIKNRATATSLAVCELDAMYRLCMTGTPFVS
jgi:SNF2 family DNA or RNA helicase